MVGIVLGTYIGLLLLLNVPVVQRWTAAIVASELGKVLGSELSIGNVDIGLLNRIVVSDLRLLDRQGSELLKVTRLSAKFDLLPLFEGKISIGNVQLFGFNVAAAKETPEAKPNFQFVLDAFAPRDTVKRDTRLDLRVNSVLIRRGRISYDVLSAPQTPGRFNASHIALRNVSANISLKALRNDSVNAAIKRLSVEEENSGFELSKLKLKLVGNTRGARIENFSIELPHTALSMDTIRLAYDSLSALTTSAGTHIDFHLLPSQVVLQDLAPFLPALAWFKEPLSVEMKASGNGSYLDCPRIAVKGGSGFRLEGNLTVQDLALGGDAFLFGNLSRLYANQEGIAFFVRNLSRNYTGVPPTLQQLETVNFDGEVSGYLTAPVMYGRLRTGVGTLHTDLMLSSNKAEGRFAYQGKLKTEEFQLGTLLGNEKLGKITFNLDLDGTHRHRQHPDVTLKGVIASFDYSGYDYENITLDGVYRQGGFAGSVALDDPNGTIALNGVINTAERTPTFNFRAHIDRLRPHDLRLTADREGAELSVSLKADFTGGSIDDMDGEINVDSLHYTSPTEDYFLNNLKVLATHKNGQEKQLLLTSDFMQGSIEGDYSYKTLPASVMNIIRHYIPTLLPEDEGKKAVATTNNFGFDLHIYNTDFFSSVLQLPLTVYTHSTLKGYFNDRAQRLRVEGYFPRLRWKDKFIESAMLACENPDDRFRTRVRFNQLKSDGSLNVSVEASASNDSIDATVNWGNSSAVTYSGQLSATTRFTRPQAEEATPHKKPATKPRKPAPLRTEIDIHPTHIILSDTLWQIHPSQVVLDSGKVHVNNFYFSHQERRHLRANGTISKEPTDTVRLDLKDINIAYVFDMADLGVSFRGYATGPAFASGLLGTPAMSTDLHIRQFGPFTGVLGDADIHGEWHHDVKGILLRADIREQDLARTLVDGYVYPLKPISSLDLNIRARNTNLGFIHYFMQSITPEFKARATGDVRLYGKFKALTMQGGVDADASLKVDVLNTTFNLKDSIRIEPGGLTFAGNRIFDQQGRQGSMNGYLRYRHFKDLQFLFNFNVDNMLVMNTKESPDFPFYGTIYGTGNASISGGVGTGVNIDVAMTTNRNSTFTYIKDYVSTAVSNQFIKFVDKTPRRYSENSTHLSEFERAQKQAVEDREEESEADLRLNLQVDATPDADMRIVMDPIAGDYISGRGTGSIRAEFYNKADDIKLFGSYRLSQGVYKFSLQEVIRKDFVIRDGSTITFSGHPGDATLDIHAAYVVNSASLNDLMPNAAEYVNQTNVKVNCMMDISGELTSPEIALGLELPQERDEVQALVRNYIPTDEQMQMQILYLLGVGKFYTPDNVETAQNSNMMSSVLSSTLSGQLNNALSNIINNNNWNVGTNFSTGEKGWTDMEFQGMLSGQLLNNRLLINGNFGYRENPLANTNFVGDFEAEWLVNRSGDIRLRAYNETNDRYYTRTNLTTQGIGIIFKKEFNKWSELLFWNKWKLKRAERRKAKEAGKD